jgi:YbbR domain-containing protein
MLEHLPLKLLSLGLATALWFVIAGEKTSEMGVTAPLELQNFPKDLELTGEPMNAVEVRLRASPGIIQRMDPSDVSAQLDLTGLKEGEHIIHLTPEAIRIPFGVKVVKITPASLTLNLERTMEKSVSIRPRVLGRPAPGFEVSEITSEPPEVRIAGPKSRVQEVESAFTEPLAVDGAKSTVVDQLNIGVEDSVLRIQGNPRVKVTARIQEAQSTRTFEAVILEVKGGGPPPPRLPRVRVVLAGPASLLDDVKPTEVHATVDLTAEPTEGTLPVTVELVPSRTGLTVRTVEPDRVSVGVSRPRRDR